MPDGVTALFNSTRKYVNNLVYQKYILLRWRLQSIRAPPSRFEIRLFQIKRRLFFVAYNHKRAFLEFERKWARKRAEYREAGMSEDAIDTMYWFDRATFNRDRAYLERKHFSLEALGEYEDSIEKVSDDYNRYFRASYDDCLTDHSNYWWIEDIDNPMIAAYIKQLSQKDKQILSMFVFQGQSQKYIAQKVGLSPSTVWYRIEKMKKIIKNISDFRI